MPTRTSRTGRAKSGRTGRWLRRASAAALVALALVIAVVVALRLAGYHFAVVSSGSMVPALEIGDVVIINTNDVEPNVGDLFTFTDTEGTLITHRAVDVDTDGRITTMGDANPVVDRTIDADDQRVGTTTKVASRVGLPIVDERVRRGLIAGAVVLCFASMLWKRTRRLPSDRVKPEPVEPQLTGQRHTAGA